MLSYPLWGRYNNSDHEEQLHHMGIAARPKDVVTKIEIIECKLQQFLFFSFSKAGNITVDTEARLENKV